jgi:hypothetical protein
VRWRRVFQIKPSHARLGAKIAHAHVGIGSGRPTYRDLEQKLLKLKEAKRRKQLKQEKQVLRKSPERKIGQVLLAPPPAAKAGAGGAQKISKTGPRSGSGPASEYQQWLEARRVKNEDIASLRDEARVCLPAVHQHHHACLQHPGGVADRVRRISPESGLRKMGADSGR